MTFDTPEQHIAYLEDLARDMHRLFVMNYLTGETPDDIQRQRAYLSADKRVRELGLLKVKAKA
jgi:hypothetical protein